MTRWRKWLGLLCMLALLNVLCVPDARAQINCSTALQGLTTRIVSCIKGTLMGMATVHFAHMRNELRTVVGAVLTLYVILFGFSVVLGRYGSKVGGPAVAMVLTASGVAFFTLGTGLEDYMTILIGAQQGMVDLVTTSLGSSTTGSGCVYGGEYGVWRRIDCTIATLMGAQPLGTTGNYGDMGTEPFDVSFRKPGFALFLLMAGLIFIPPFGPVVLLLGFGAIVLLILAFIQAIFVYIQALVVVIILGIVGPICIPCILFKPTQSIFTRWLQLLISYVIQPAILFAYLAFMIHVLGIATSFTGITSLYATTQDSSETRKMKDSVVEYKSDTQKYEKGPVAPAATPETGKGSETASLYMPSLRFVNNPLEKMALLVQGLLVMVMVLAMTLSFMFNVMQMGAQLAGMTSAGTVMGLNFFTKGVNVTKGAIEGGMTGGKIGAIKGAIDGLKK